VRGKLNLSPDAVGAGNAGSRWVILFLPDFRRRFGAPNGSQADDEQREQQMIHKWILGISDEAVGPAETQKHFSLFLAKSGLKLAKRQVS
jgi:hypothetical protein